jgi:predicted nucleic acid-binding protein
MRAVFADSFYFVALMSERDEGHARAVAFTQSSRVALITSEWILIEVGDALSQVNRRADFVKLLENLRKNPRVTIIDATHDVFVRGVRLFAARSDKEWSLTDCTSFVLMEEHSLQEALTADHHFQQAGFAPPLS